LTLRPEFSAHQQAGGSANQQGYHQSSQQASHEPPPQSYNPQSFYDAGGNQPQQGSYAQPTQAWGGHQQPLQNITNQQTYPQPSNQQQTYQPPSHQWTSGADGDASVTNLRNQAIAEGDAMKQCFDGAHQAHESGDGARAKQLSTEGHQHQSRRDELNKQAAKLIFQGA
jgi:hypothetical protein